MHPLCGSIDNPTLSFRTRFRATTHDHDLRVKVPANYASDKDLVEKYVSETLYDSGSDIATASLYSAVVVSTN